MTTSETHLNFRSVKFDHIFINFVPLVAISSAFFVVLFPDHFQTILLIDLFLFGYHHVISTYTRLSKSNLTDNEFKFIIYILPALVLTGVVLCVRTEYIWMVPTIYLHWQWWHYTRQSEGISKSIKYKTKSKDPYSDSGSHWSHRRQFYLSHDAFRNSGF